MHAHTRVKQLYHKYIIYIFRDFHSIRRMRTNKESFMAGRSGSNTRQSGEILINGLKQKLGFGTSVRDKLKDKHIIIFFLFQSKRIYISLIFTYI